jgi:hypothetical protein
LHHYLLLIISKPFQLANWFETYLAIQSSIFNRYYFFLTPFFYSTVVFFFYIGPFLFLKNYNFFTWLWQWWILQDHPHLFQGVHYSAANCRQILRLLVVDFYFTGWHLLPRYAPNCKSVISLLFFFILPRLL